MRRQQKSLDESPLYVGEMNPAHAIMRVHRASLLELPKYSVDVDFLGRVC